MTLERSAEAKDSERREQTTDSVAHRSVDGRMNDSDRERGETE